MASWAELNERSRESQRIRGLRARIDAFVLVRDRRVRSLSPSERADWVRPSHSPVGLHARRLAETGYLLAVGPPVLALRFGVAIFHRRKGLST